MTNKRVKDWLAEARRLFSEKDAGFEIQLSTQILLAHVLGQSRPWLIAHPDAPITQEQEEQSNQLLTRLLAGEPLPYLIGHWEFYGQDFEVNPAVLIPRPETEILVERAIGWFKSHPCRRIAADVGTGSGCIAISIARHVSEVRFLAVDRSPEALDVARRNAARLGVAGQIQFTLSNLLFDTPGPFDLVAANLPYIPEEALQTLEVAKHEPHLALNGGPDGLDAIRSLVHDAPRWLAPGGLMLLEIQYDQGERVADLARQSLPGAQVEVIHDYAGLQRIVSIERED